MKIFLIRLKNQNMKFSDQTSQLWIFLFSLILLDWLSLQKSVETN